MFPKIYIGLALALLLPSTHGKTVIFCIASYSTDNSAKVVNAIFEATGELKGTVIANAYAQPSYEESRLQLLSGNSVYPIKGNDSKIPQSQLCDLMSMPEIFKKSGYSTILLSNNVGQTPLPPQCTTHQWTENLSSASVPINLNTVTRLLKVARNYAGKTKNQFIMIDALLTGSTKEDVENLVDSFEHLITANESSIGILVSLPRLSNARLAEKFDTLDESLRSPCYYIQPGKLQEGRSVGILVPTYNHFPTICELAQINSSVAKAQFSGRSIMGPLLKLPMPWADFPIVANWLSPKGRLFTFRDKSRRGIYSYDLDVWTLFDLREGADPKLNVKSGSEPFLSRIEKNFGINRKDSN